MPRKGGVPENLVRTGRPPGRKNKFTNLKNDILQAYKERGGVDFLSKTKEKHFIKLICELLPKKIEAEHSGKIGLKVEITDFSKIVKK